MLSITPEFHASLLGAATIAALLFAGIILARNPKSSAARMHAVYGGLAAWWFFCMGTIAISSSPGEVEAWARLVHLSIGMLPAAIFHLNVATAGLSHGYRRGIRLHYAASTVVTIFGLSWPDLFGEPRAYSWGLYPSYTAWGLIPFAALAIVFVEVIAMYRRALRDGSARGARRRKLRVFYHGNAIAALALIDFLPVFGFGVYPFGFAIMTVLHIATVFGSIRYRLIEITPEFAATQILDTLPDGVLVLDSRGVTRLANQTGARMIGRDLGEIIGQPLADVAPEALRPLAAYTLDVPQVDETTFSPGNGQSRYTVRPAGTVLLDQSGARVGKVWVLHDLTRQRRAEEEKDELQGWVRHSQKLETLGVMAGGIAHDFNNLLTAILGNADVALARLKGDDRVGDELEAIVAAAERATELTNQMLTFAGQGSTREAALDLNALCSEIGELLRTAISRKSGFHLEFAEDLPLVLGDRGQLIQVIINLVTNASDALGDSVGSISLRTGTMKIDAPGDESAEESGIYATLEISDTGSGMDAATREHIFEPFFTTKFAGRGLGLAVVLRIVQAHGGRIKVESEPGQGTRFTIALPAAATASLPVAKAAETAPWSGSGIALLADDEPEVRRVTARMLARAGFRIIEAAHGREAVAAFHSQQDQISLVILDVTMPEMDGRQAMLEIRSLSQSVPIILMSGYSDAAVDVSHHERIWFLGKPFRFSALVEKVREAMA